LLRLHSSQTLTQEFGRRVNAIVAARGSVDWSSGLTAVLEKTGTGALGSSLTVSCCGLGDELMSVVTVLHKLHYLDGLSEMDITQNGIGPRSTEQWRARCSAMHDLCSTTFVALAWRALPTFRSEAA